MNFRTSCFRTARAWGCVCLCVCAGKVWSLPAVSNEVQSLICPAFLQLPSLDPLCCCTPCPVGAQFAGPCWVLAESKAAYLLLWDRIQNLLPFLCHCSLTKPTSEAAGGSAALPPTSSPSWGTGGSPPALWPLCAARVGSQQQLGVRLMCPASSSALPRSIQRGFASLSSWGRFPGLFGRGPITRRVVAFQAEQKILGNVQPRGKECPSLHPSLFCLASADFQKERIVFFYFSINGWKRCWGPFSQ